MMLLPLKMEDVFTRTPIANAVLIVVISLVSIFSLIGIFSIEDVEEYVLRDWDLGQMIGCTFLHANLIHLLGNMLFLWIFGNAICSAVGNATYPLFYLILGFFASASQLLSSEMQSIGASGAIFGVVGMTFVLFPTNRIRCWYAIFLPYWVKMGTFVTKTYWVILYFLIFENILPALGGRSGVGYGAHLGGFAAGMVLGICLILFKAVDTFEPTLGELLTGGRKERDSYDLEELKEIDSQRSRIATQATSAIPMSGSTYTATNIDPILTAAYSYKAEPLLVLRVLNFIRKGNLTTIFFVNDGDAVGDIKIEATTATIIEFQPLRTLGKRTTGWIKLQGRDEVSLQDFRFSLSYDIGTGYRLTKEFTYDASQKKFLGQ